MGVFTRFKDIISANLNSMLDKAEDPEKMIRLMIQEMEETLIELKASCAGTMANRVKVNREIEAVTDRIQKWETRAKLAIEKGDEDLAREALYEKQRYQQQLEALETEQTKFDDLVKQAQDDIAKLEEKMESARQKQRLLIQRHIRAERKMEAENRIRKAKSIEVVSRFEEYEHKIDRMEAAAGLVNPKTKPGEQTLEDKFSHLENEEQIESELEALKKSVKPSGKESAPTAERKTASEKGE